MTDYTLHVSHATYARMQDAAMRAEMNKADQTVAAVKVALEARTPNIQYGDRYRIVIDGTEPSDLRPDKA